MSKFAGKHFAILGAGRSGLGAARLARLHGAEVTVMDEGAPEKIKSALDKQHAEGFRTLSGQAAKDLVVNPGDYDLVILSPGLDAGWPFPKKFTDAGVPLTGEMEFAFNLTDMELVGITGTNGKSTCTELIAHLFNACGKKSVPCGNHGMSLSEVVSSGVPYDVLSLEISSFQLETIQNYRAKASLWLNFAPDHLDRYPGMEEYYAAKARIFENVTGQDVAIVRAGETVDTGKAKKMTFSAYGAEADWTYQGGRIHAHPDGVVFDVKSTLRGRHNMENVMAAMMACQVHGLSLKDMRAALNGYEAPAHRCELVRVLNGREFINDSKATNLHALEACIGAMERPIVLIVGGKEKGLDYTPLRASLNGQVRAMVCIGEIAGALKATFQDLLPCQTAVDMADAVQQAAQISKPGDSIILSPGTSSFDMYTGYAQRGEAFRSAVQSLN
ncbi:UDP-N-acetylmuramoylalanine--D-glutamate ligase [Prosthecobacter fusiformis]|uniref:UDP-N-acetylmuramoylalanine--D-glutamate ligase n=1 Tax=Prosthecobacter fusiformis TaxID=48464 RepID=A0A4R7RMP0_9BACT|nr:UDP-N-acetylmuramoyl-L-alanine--D-glutamate ligase [Prosthecobacter fusiformis]TDU64244.1 UDP-N-acetylmuramoylalanine--D-glutamate ligase [Prosthecobacter fusiformis]